MTGHGGWPLNAFLTPEGVPFYAGTYFPPEPRQGMPSWRQVLDGVAEAWREQRERDRARPAGASSPRLRGAGAAEAPEGELDPAALDAAVAALRRGYDATHGGFGRRAEVPGRVGDRVPARAAASARWRCTRCARWPRGGMYDQIGGGFSRYSVDARWIVPHFEKMLYDNALLARAYLHGWQVSRRAVLRARVHGDARLGAARAAPGRRAASPPRWTPTPRASRAGSTSGRPTRCARRSATDAERRDRVLRDDRGAATSRARTSRSARRRTPSGSAEIKARLLAARERRVRPGLDDKRLTAWNALMISALADAGAALERADYRDAAVAAAEFVLRDLRDARRPAAAHLQPRARPSSPPTSRTTRSCSRRCSTLYEATFDPRWFGEARALADAILERFADRERGGFFSTADDHEPLIARRKDLEDTPIPSGASAAAFGLLRLARLTGEHRYEEAALGVLRLLHTLAPQHPARVRAPPAGARLRARRRCARWRSSAPDAAPLERVVREGLPPARRAGGRRAPATCRCSRAASRWTGARRRTCASASRAGGR